MKISGHVEATCAADIGLEPQSSVMLLHLRHMEFLCVRVSVTVGNKTSFMNADEVLTNTFRLRITKTNTHLYSLGLAQFSAFIKSHTSVMTMQKPAVSHCAEFSGWNTSLCSNSNSFIFILLTVTTYSWLIMKLSERLWLLFFKLSFL